jgi:hypothetical protein
LKEKRKANLVRVEPFRGEEGSTTIALLGSKRVNPSLI